MYTYVQSLNEQGWLILLMENRSHKALYIMKIESLFFLNIELVFVNRLTEDFKDLEFMQDKEQREK